MELQQNRELYHFGAFRLDAAARRLWRADELIPLTPKQFDLLFYFVENAGRIAKKSELLDAVWADTYVEETTLARNVSWLRKLLDDGANGEQLIETVSKLGYRFTAEVTHSDGDTLIIEAQIIQHIRGEETITFDDDATEAIFNKEAGRKIVVVPSKTSRFRQSLMIPIIAVSYTHLTLPTNREV